MKTLSIYLLLVTSLCYGQSTNKIRGTLRDASSGAPISFATVHIDGTTIGTFTNLNGGFELHIPAAHVSGRLVLSCMGYDGLSLEMPGGTAQALQLTMTPSLITLDEVVVYPVSEETYIKRAVAKFSTNYVDRFLANAYFRQMGHDNGNLLQFSEGYMQVVFADFLDDTTRIDQRMLLYEVEQHLDTMRFRKHKRDKKLAKAQKKAEKEGITLDEDSVKRKAAKVGFDILTPEIIMDQDPVRQLETFFDSTQFDKYNYTFGNDMMYLGRPVKVINFQTRKKAKLRNMGLKGHIDGVMYFDEKTDAIVGVDYAYDMVIPTALKPLLFLTGFHLSNPTMHSKIRYLAIGDQWFPQSIQVDMGLVLEQRYLFRKNERSDLDFELLMSLSDIQTDEIKPIPETYRFNKKKPMKEQLYPFADSSWERVNRIQVDN